MTQATRTDTPNSAHAAVSSSPPSTSAPFEPSFGAITLGNGQTRFRLWAPNASGPVSLEIVGRDPIPMKSAGEGFYEVEVACPPGTRYRYRVAPDLAVPDPASRQQDGDVHDDSVVLARGTYLWRHPAWRGRPWEETVLYEIHPGIAGGYAGIMARLPELAALGITALELMPIADFPGKRNWGYDGVLPYAPDSAYGEPDALKQLIDAAHGLGMMVFLDVVYNHFGPDGNYLHAYASDFFRSDVQTPWGDAIDFRRPQVRAFFAENALYWLTEYRFDGLRLDAVHAIGNVPWLEEMAAFVRAEVERATPGRHIHLVLENDDNQARPLEHHYDAQWNDDAHHVLHHLLTGEAEGYYADFASQPAQRLARCLGEGFVYQGEHSGHRGAERGEPSGHLRPSAFVLFLQNHDQIGNRAMGERLLPLIKHDVRRLRAAIALQLLAPQVPLIFMGEERGATTPFLYFTDHNPDLAATVRDGRRKEFEKFPAFSSPATRDRIPDPNDPATFTASNPYTDAPDPALSLYYQSLLQVRHRIVAPRLRGARTRDVLVLGQAAVVAQWELNDGAVLSLYTNLGGDDLQLSPSLAHGGECTLFESEPDAGQLLRNGVLARAATVGFLKDPE